MIARGRNFEEYSRVARSNFCGVMEPEGIISCEVNGTPEKQTNRLKDLSNALDMQALLSSDFTT